MTLRQKSRHLAPPTRTSIGTIGGSSTASVFTGNPLNKSTAGPFILAGNATVTGPH